LPNCFRSGPALQLEDLPGRTSSTPCIPSVTHQSTDARRGKWSWRSRKRTGKIPLSYHMLSAFSTVTIEKWDNFQTLNYPYGHCILTGYMGLRPRGPETLEYERVLAKAYGENARRKYSPPNIHHVLIYPGPFGAVAAAAIARGAAPGRGQDADRDLAFPPERRPGADLTGGRSPTTTWVNSPSTLINCRRPGELLEGASGPSSDGGDWVSFPPSLTSPRYAEKDGIVETAAQLRTSEAPMRKPDEGLDAVHGLGEVAMAKRTARKAAARGGRSAPRRRRPTATTRSTRSSSFSTGKPSSSTRNAGRTTSTSSPRTVWYWMPPEPSHATWDGMPAIFRRGQEPDDGAHEARAAPGRLVAAPRSGARTTWSATSSSSANRRTATWVGQRSRFHMMELRRDDVAPLCRRLWYSHII